MANYISDNRRRLRAIEEELSSSLYHYCPQRKTRVPLAGLIVAVLGAIGLFWATSTFERGRYRLRELMLFVGYWAVVFAFVSAVLNL